MDLETLTNILVLTYVIPIVMFIVLYATRSPWTATELGIALMFQKLAILGICLLITLGLWLGDDYWGRDVLRALVYGAVGFFLWLDVINLVRYQKGRRRLAAARLGAKHREGQKVSKPPEDTLF